MQRNKEDLGRLPAPRLRDVMSRDVVSVSPDTPLVELMELLMSRHISGVPVVAGRKVIGVVSATDLLSFAVTSTGRPAASEDDTVPDKWAADGRLEELAEEQDDGDEEAELLADYIDRVRDSGDELSREWEEFSADGRRALHEYTVADVMSRDVQWLPAATDVTVAAEFMKRAGVHRVLVMDGDELEGIVSSMDIVQAVARRQIPPIEVSLPHEADFDAGWTREPVVREG